MNKRRGLDHHHVTIRKFNQWLWHIRCVCGYFHGQVTWRASWKNAAQHLARHRER